MDAEKIARDEYEAHRNRVNRATDREMALTLPSDDVKAEAGFIAKLKRESWRAGYEAAREQAAAMMQAWDYRGHADAIRSMEPK